MRLPVLVLALMSLAGAAQAQAFVDPLCRGYVAPAELHYDSAEHARWYKRFWTGECDHLFACVAGSPNWNDIAARLVARAPAPERGALQAKTCRLGQKVGLEWAREHNVRRITTADLRRFHALLEAAGDPLHGIETVDAAVQAKLAQPAKRAE